MVVKDWETLRHASVPPTVRDVLILFFLVCNVPRAVVRNATHRHCRAAEGHAPVGHTVPVVHLLWLDHANLAATVIAYLDSTVLVVRATLLDNARGAATRVR